MSSSTYNHSQNQNQDEDCSIDYESFGIHHPEDTYSQSQSHSKEAILTQEANQLQSKINFLQKCSEARLALDHVQSLTLQSSSLARNRNATLGLGGAGTKDRDPHGTSTSRKCAAAAGPVSVPAAHQLSLAHVALQRAINRTKFQS